jgi:hypothetical protein
MRTMDRLWTSEPARTVGWPVAVLVALATFFVSVGDLDPVTWQTVVGAAGVALGQLAALLVGTEAVRGQVWSRRSVTRIEAGYEQEIADVEAKVDAIASAEAALASYHRDLDG